MPCSMSSLCRPSDTPLEMPTRFSAFRRKTAARALHLDTTTTTSGQVSAGVSDLSDFFLVAVVVLFDG